MSEIQIVLEGDNALEAYLTARPNSRLRHGTVFMIAGLAGGMTSGLPSVSLIGTGESWNDVIVTEISLKQLQMAVAALTQRYGDCTGGIFTITSDGETAKVEQHDG